MKFSNEQNEKYAFVAHCGLENRVIARVGETVYVGCRVGTRDEIETAIRNDYKHREKSQSLYLKKIDLLFKSKLSDFKDIKVCRNGAFRLAAMHGLLEMVQYLHEKGADINTCKDSALYWSMKNGHIHVVEYLKNNGA